MSKICCLLLIMLALVIAGCQVVFVDGAESVDLRVMTFNIRNGRAQDGENGWHKRKQQAFDLIKQQSVDVLGIQEAFRFQLDELGQAVSGYGEIGEARAGGSEDEYSAILYRKKRFVVDESGTFWLSDTPAIPSRHWGNSHFRICTWARLIDKESGRAFYFYNTHLDNRSQPSREKSVRLIASAIQQRMHPDPFILMGDFNAGEDSPVIEYLSGKGDDTDVSPVAMVDSFRAIHVDSDPVGTYNDFVGRENGPKIDYIFVEAAMNVIDADIIRENDRGRFPSDHYPVTAHLKF